MTLVSHFVSAVESTSGGTVVVTERNPGLSAACQLVDTSIQVPSVLDPTYPDLLLEICKLHDISLVVPTIDTELLLLSQLRDDWKNKHGIQIVIADQELVAKCRNKRETATLFDGLDIATPQEFFENSSPYPRFIKPISGSRSIDIHTAAKADDVPERLKDRTKFIHQELIKPEEFQEYTVDAYFNFNGSLGCVVPRLRIEVRDGEVSKGKTHKGLLLPFLRERLSRMSGAIGCLTLQFFVKESPGSLDVLGIEINPRFGGGYPLTHAAGGSYVDWLVREHFTDHSIAYTDGWVENLTMLRFDSEVYVRG